MAKFGISVALLTPFTETGAIDLAEIGAHASRMVQAGASGVTLFGTTGEGASIAASERDAAVKAVLDAGLSPDQLVLGVAETSLGDAAARIAEGLALGVTRFLVLPPYYFKNNEDDGLFDWHMDLLAQTDDAAQLILYHIPQVTYVPLSVDLIGRLATAAPKRIIAIKDSSGSWENTEALLQQGLLPVLVGDERQLHRAAALGAAGSICGVANLYPERLVKLFETQTEDKELSARVTAIVSGPVVPALKALIAKQRGEAGWDRVRNPQRPLSETARAGLFSAIEAPAVDEPA
ncbi:dihydrodipicolinate synthase family protein [Primorskyibacter marinus]|uniref:dihydrodipicolinate synthase family protein n=1 Tax=Primorskyibacter marinus TaxID=1977320 RepID=UPI0013005BC9|nr:dihydrodipicolinate synthase family protein [Primorskyibacter marinus]